jgi:hypothetical protein
LKMNFNFNLYFSSCKPPALAARVLMVHIAPLLSGESIALGLSRVVYC